MESVSILRCPLTYSNGQQGGILARDGHAKVHLVNSSFNTAVAYSHL